MTLDQIAVFEQRWPTVRARLDVYLSGRNIPRPQREDLIQEVAARLVAKWSTVDLDQPLWPLAKTIALNLLRDEARRGPRETLAETPEELPTPDAAAQALARVELAEVARAMGGLSEAHRAVLLAQIVDDMHASRGADADKMLRLRARRRLRKLLDGSAAFLPARLRATDLGSLLGGLKDVAAGGMACALCLTPLLEFPTRRTDVAPSQRVDVAIEIPEAHVSISIAVASDLATATSIGLAPRSQGRSGSGAGGLRGVGGSTAAAAEEQTSATSGSSSGVREQDTPVPSVPVGGGGPPPPPTVPTPPAPALPPAPKPERGSLVPELPEPPEIPTPEVGVTL